MRRYLYLGLICLVCVACSRNPDDTALYGTDITAAAIKPAFNLIDHQGKPQKIENFAGKVVVINFGYTHCPDVCPTTLLDLANALKLMGSSAEQVQVLFVTVDPARDTEEVLAQYVPSFNPTFIGLRGDDKQLDAVVKSFKAYYAKADDKKNYTVDHSAGSYVLDKNGNVRIYIQFGEKSAHIAHDLQSLL
ncbi:SCO family protein [Methyloradius palustris]|uniref:Lipoprotein n=1 Tax=Methyloradius palustris TaxID=2778876 RepID=A0A8D5K053_9PROT|nr:SCO family protein [Methyloradius palustris]BCM24403.1 lipoprotein [Methyloradius palustris]